MLLLLFLVLPLVVESAPASTDPLPLDCEDVYNSGSVSTGVYTIYPGGSSKPVQVYCDMGCDEDKGRWTVFQRRMDGSVNFYRPWDEYKNGFGNASGEYWLGLQNIFLITNRGKYELRIYMEDFERGSVYAHYTSFYIDSETYRYKLHISGFINGGAGNSLAIHNGQKFSTFDKDDAGTNCAKTYLGGFWYANCHHTNPNGIYLWGLDKTYYGIGNCWYHWKGHEYGLKFISMKIRPVFNK
ncbi:microfibril-associated glycoprotein 4 isoform X2 [Astyanax mexicanus]|uniref:microfibril-associated glycoprotein 4 isoform X2 n=1 Tax=Astyanax mexicanus TaxID=7994 RepID=UPI0020CAA7F4|nr:microfibril-associated glycoprotein 4 isoform X2 [Astyanax mexicanus]